MNSSRFLFSVIIPARNEEERIQEQLKFLKETIQDFPSEIIVVDGMSADQTVKIAEQFSDQVVGCPKSSRGFQMHLGAQTSSGQILVFLHADTRLPKDWQKIIVSKFFNAQPQPALAVFRLAFDSNKFIYKVISALARARMFFTGVPHGDQVFVIKRETYFKCGGFADDPLMEEYGILDRLKPFGKILLLRENVLTSARKYQRNGPVRNALMNSLFIFLFYFGVSPQRLSKWYY